MSVNQIYDSITLNLPSVNNEGLYVQNAAMRMLLPNAWLFLHPNGAVTTIAQDLQKTASPTMNIVASTSSLVAFFVIYNSYSPATVFTNNGSIVRTRSGTGIPNFIFDSVTVTIPVGVLHVITVAATLKHTDANPANSYSWAFKGGFQIVNNGVPVVTSISSATGSVGPVVGTPTVSIVVTGSSYIVRCNSGNAAGTSDAWNVSGTITSNS